jgi:S-adenosylmethionine decarboxylase
LAHLAFWQEIERAAAMPDDFHRVQIGKLSRRWAICAIIRRLHRRAPVMPCVGGALLPARRGAGLFLRCASIHSSATGGRGDAFERQFASVRRRGQFMDGIHLLGEWYGCPAHTPEFTRADTLRALCVAAAHATGLTVVGDSFHQFEPQGVTGTVLLAESHLAIHTWPEFGFVTVDVYVCNLATDNSDKAKQLFRALETALQPKRTKYQAIVRGGKDD